MNIKKIPALARKVRPFEIGSELVTYISDPSASSGYKVETTCQLSEDMVIVRNMIALCNSRGDACRDKDGNIIYNEYAMGKSVFFNSYTNPDQLLECFSQKFYKKTTIRAIEIDEQVISILHEYDQSNHSRPNDIFIATNWGTGDTAELLQPGGMLTDSGYAIAPKEFAATYVPTKKRPTFFNTTSSRTCRDNELETVTDKKIAIKTQ
ncbi:putative membrane protein [Candidatus Rickettsiella viridis]|uniref:Putative membrane protein n=1 Tax=Candidatus Rickettsiella viridis TaxID=676208 RepID=A0A2Z5UVC9_9COXI|nr:hypothetical protein [Candidatus Rickettsiella viridis]BBB15424.1 putative membrane protein [Candidatus Rickettsiella viridis]